jgi:hypothetical protein
MPHDTDKIVARLLPQGVPDPGKKKPEIFINKEKPEILEDKNCKNKMKVKKDKRLQQKCRYLAKKRKAKEKEQISEQTLEILSTHPSDERRAKAIGEHIQNKELFNKFRLTGKKNKLKNTMRDWSYDKESDSLVISDIEKDPKLIGLEETGTSGINIDKFLD